MLLSSLTVPGRERSPCVISSGLDSIERSRDRAPYVCTGGSLTHLNTHTHILYIEYGPAQQCFLPGAGGLLGNNSAEKNFAREIFGEIYYIRRENFCEFFLGVLKT